MSRSQRPWSGSRRPPSPPCLGERAWRPDLRGSSRRERFFVKWQAAGTAIDLAAEAERMAWAVAFTPVPRVLDAGKDRTGAWLVTTAVLGRSAVTERWLSARREITRKVVPMPSSE